jgi:geranylgeranyl diphosphate synthase type I
MPKKTLMFLQHKKKVDRYLSKLIKRKKKIFNNHALAAASFDYLEKFVQSGKCVRGSLFLATILEFNEEKDLEEYLPIAAGIEIIHSALLIQDDFMDQDDARRGMDALHSVEYKKAQKQVYRRPDLYAPSAVMCATDIFFFLAFEQISSALKKEKSDVWAYIANEYAHVGFAQWQDVVFAYETEDKDAFEDIENVYRYKTARYTFVMPVLVAAYLCGLDKKVIQQLEHIFEEIGMIFQMRDDYLNLFGDEILTGKPVGGDVIENKKTMYRYHLFSKLNKVSKAKREEVKSLYGKSVLTQKEIKELQTIHHKLGVTEIIKNIIDTNVKDISKQVAKLAVSNQFKNEILVMTNFVANRIN